MVNIGQKGRMKTRMHRFPCCWSFNVQPLNYLLDLVRLQFITSVSLDRGIKSSGKNSMLSFDVVVLTTQRVFPNSATSISILYLWPRRPPSTLFQSSLRKGSSFNFKMKARVPTTLDMRSTWLRPSTISTCSSDNLFQSQTLYSLHSAFWRQSFAYGAETARLTFGGMTHGRAWQQSSWSFGYRLSSLCSATLVRSILFANRLLTPYELSPTAYYSDHTKVTLYYLSVMPWSDEPQYWLTIPCRASECYIAAVW